MRLYTVTVVCRLGEDDEPAIAVDVVVEPGVPRVVIDTIPNAMRGAAESVAAQLEAERPAPAEPITVRPPETRQ